MGSTTPTQDSRACGPRKLTPALVEALVQAVRTGVPVSTALRQFGVSQGMFREWMRIAEGRQETWHGGTPVSREMKQPLEELLARLDQARAEREAEAIQRIEDAAKKPDKFGRYDWRADAWLLNNHPDYRARYHPHREITVDQHITVSREREHVLQMSNEELRAAVEGQYEFLPAPDNVAAG